MKLTDIDLSSLAEVAAAVTLLEHVHRELATGGTPLPELIVNPAPGSLSAQFLASSVPEIIVNPAQSPAGGHTHWQDADAMERFVAAEAEKLRRQGSGEVVMTQAARTLDFGFPAAPALTTGDAVVIQGLGAGTIGEAVTSMDAASVFGDVPAQSAAPLPPAPSTAGVAASPTAPAAPPASGALPTLPALAPLPAPLAAVPAAPAAPLSPAGGVELDTDGLPWDDRIHAGTKRKNDDGRWAKKRGLNDPAFVTRVVAQLRAQMATGGLISGNVNAQPAQSATPLPVSTPALPVVPTPAAPQQSSGAPAPTTYLDFMTAATVEVQSGRVPIEAFGAVCKSFGGVEALNAKPELIPAAWASLKAKYPGML